MKKIIAVLLIGLLMLSLTGCFGMGQTTTATEDPDATEPLAASAYEKSFKGLKQFMIDHKLVTAGSETEVYYDLIGADDGARFVLSGNAFIEFYDFSKADSSEAKATLADMKDDGKFIAVEGLDELTAVISKSGKYAAVYNAKNSYDYAKVTDELENW